MNILKSSYRTAYELKIAQDNDWAHQHLIQPTVSIDGPWEYIEKHSQYEVDWQNCPKKIT